jgi:hypothetical protein
MESDSLPGLAGLADDVLTEVAHTLALVGLRLAQLADVGGHLAHDLLVGALHRDAVGGGHVEGDALGGLHLDGVAETEGEVERVGALGGGAVAHADDLELLDEAVGHADDHVVHQGAHQAVHGPGLTLVVGTLHQQGVTLLADGDGAGQVTLERALGALDGDVAVGDGDVDAARHRDGGLTDAGHGALLPDEAQDLAAHVALARLAVGHETLAGRDDGDTQPTEDPGDLAGGLVHAEAGLGHPTETGDGPGPFGRVLHGDGEGAARAVAVGGHLVVLDVALLLQDAREGLLLLGGRHEHLVVHRRVGVADTGEHVGDGVGHGHVRPPSPARLGHAGDLPGMDHVSQTHAAEQELAVHRVRATALLAPGVAPDLELGLAVGLVDQCFLGH